jgi:hypothetical protein
MRPQRTYKIEAKETGHPKSVYLPVWRLLPRGKADGAMMALDAMYGGSTAYRLVCEQTSVVLREIAPHPAPKVR